MRAFAKEDFTDVAQGKYYTEAVAWGAENKIVEGYGDGKFGPQDIITREQMAVNADLLSGVDDSQLDPRGWKNL